MPALCLPIRISGSLVPARPANASKSAMLRMLFDDLADRCFVERPASKLIRTLIQCARGCGGGAPFPAGKARLLRVAS